MKLATDNLPLENLLGCSSAMELVILRANGEVVTTENVSGFAMLVWFTEKKSSILSEKSASPSRPVRIGTSIRVSPSERLLISLFTIMPSAFCKFLSQESH